MYISKKNWGCSDPETPSILGGLLLKVKNAMNRDIMVAALGLHCNI